MKYRRLLLLFPFAFSIYGCAKSTEYHPKELDPNVTYDNVYLIMGQSNASGISPWSYLESKSPEVYQKYSSTGEAKVLMSYDTVYQYEQNFKPVKFGFSDGDDFFGPEIGISEVLKEKEETSYVIKASLSGSCLQTEYVNKDGRVFKYYNRFVNFIKQQIKKLEKEGKNPRLRGVFWMQGESDAFGLQDTYKEAEAYFIKYLRADLNDYIYDHFNFVDAEINDDPNVWVYYGPVNQGKLENANEMEHVYCIKTNGEDEEALNLKTKAESSETEDVAHYDSLSMLALGKKAAEYLIK